MKAKLVVIASEKKRKDGFPLYVSLVHGKQRTRKCIARINLDFWNSKNNIPFKQHENYNNLMALVMDFNSKCAKINLGTYTFEGAKSMLFLQDIEKQTKVFFEVASAICDNSTTGKLNQTILNSWNKIYPGIDLEEITPKHVKRYMDLMLQVNSANGVHTYIRKLSTLFVRISEYENPFKGIRPKKQKTKQKNLTKLDLKKIINTYTYLKKYDGRNTLDSINFDRYYYLLMFYLGGIDMVDLAHLRYDKHVIDGRIQLFRNKGGTDSFINNKLFPEALELLKRFDCYPYLVPIYKYKDYHSFVNKFNKRFADNTLDLKLTRKPLTKSARYTFINLAQQLLIDQRITMEIVGHSQTTTHSIYTDVFPLEVRDQAHLKIIDSVK